MSNISNKVKVPAVVGVIISITLGVLTALTAVPQVAPYVAIGVTAINAVAGYFTYES